MGLGTFIQPLNWLFLVFRFLVSPSGGDVADVSLECRRGLWARLWACESVYGWPLKPWALWAEHTGPIRALGLGGQVGEGGERSR